MNATVKASKASKAKATVNAAKAEASATSAIAWYKPQLANWQVKVMGAKPSEADFALAHSLGAKPGSKTAMALAMYLRNEGASQAQVVNVNGGPYLNKMRALIQANQAVQMPTPRNELGHVVYKLALPVKAKAKAKATSKPRKAKAKPEVAKPEATATEATN